MKTIICFFVALGGIYYTTVGAYKLGEGPGQIALGIWMVIIAQRIVRAGHP